MLNGSEQPKILDAKGAPAQEQPAQEQPKPEQTGPKVAM